MSESDENRSSPASSEVGVGGINEKVANDFAAEKGVNIADVLPVLEHITLDEARDIIRQTIEGRESDPNFDADLLKRARNALKESELSQEAAHLLMEELKLEAALFDDSPYLQVRAVVDSTDDPDMPVNTVTFGGNGVYSTDIIFVQRLPQYFNQTQIGYQILMTLATQMLGFGVAGLARRFLVYPPSMIWPSNLATIALNKSFHDMTNKPANGWTITRIRFFTYVFTAYALYFVLPDAIMQFLSYFNWMCWISPNNVRLALITGSVSGLGINPWTTFDWNVLISLCDPIITPLYAVINLALGMSLIGIPFICIVYFKNYYYTAYLTINSSGLFDNTGSSYNVSRVLNSDYRLDEAAYAAYSQPYQSAGYACMFFCFFACYTGSVVHAGLYHYPEIWSGFKAVLHRQSARNAYGDVHNRLMRRYKEVPEWWFAIVLVIASLVLRLHFSSVRVPRLHSGSSTYASPVSVIPIGIVTAVTNLEITTNVIGEVIGGYVLPGKPLAVMLFKTYSLMPLAQAVGYAQDMKLGHYVKIIPAIYVALFFNFYVRRRYQDWWAKYTYVLATGLRSAIGIAGIVWFFAILVSRIKDQLRHPLTLLEQYNNYEPDWWPNSVSYAGCDGDGCPLLPIPDIGYFGPAPVVA
ncbi:hypothetical protein P7C70_g1089, partial [Phenoliferia sp. Uapishka_3]